MSFNTGQTPDSVYQGEGDLRAQNSGSYSFRSDIMSTPPHKIRTPDFDRLLPQRSLNPVQDLQMRIVTEESSKKRKLSVIEEEAQQAMLPLRETTDDIIHRLNSTPTKSSKRLLSFSTPTKERNYFFDSPVKRDYNSSPLPLEAQLILTSPRKPPRYISRTPYKVLDAPDLQA
ncbi:6157_t:CDS:2, partial [Racocetra fulgida]